MDIEGDEVRLDSAPVPPEGYAVERVDVVVRLRKLD
jgi:hypothetical protein